MACLALLNCSATTHFVLNFLGYCNQLGENHRLSDAFLISYWDHLSLEPFVVRHLAAIEHSVSVNIPDLDIVAQ